MSGDHFNTRNLPADPNWQFGNQSINIQLPNSSIPSYQEIQMASSSFPQVLNHPSNPQNSAFSDNAMALPNNLPIGMFLPKNLGILPPSLSDFSPDSSFIERAAKFSSFTAGNYTALVNPFKMKDSSMSIDHGSRCESPINNQRDNVNAREETHDMANVSGDSSSKGLNAKKRKKNNQDLELDQVQEETQFSAEIPKGNVGNKQNVECSSSKSSGKNGKGSTDGAKQDYVHVRARRGQATNSHSLAERVRRERISERMKHLQDIVPGCSKVTGKAVMLDEIINYVQSLQRQVEFLSMKLATVNPSTDLNIKGLLSKDILQPQAGSTPMNFLPDLIHPQLLSSQHGLVQSGTHGIVNHSDAFRRAVNAQFAAMNGFKDPTNIESMGGRAPEYGSNEL